MMPEKYPVPLFLQCIEFVADNIDIVESFVGFPSQIGQHIFKSCLNKKKFMTGNLTSLELFASEFGAELLNSLNLSGEYLCLNYYLENLLLFKDLTELDVSHCGVGDDHEILANLANLHRLQIFNLSGNCVSDAGIQRMTTPYRMLNRGPNSLELLDISGNSGVTVKCLKYLSPFLTLTVRLPGPLPEKTEPFQKWKFKIDTSYRAKTIVTRGWASSVINEWIVHVKSRKPAIKPTKKTFYSKTVYPHDFSVSSTKSYTPDVIIAQNRSRELQEKQANSVVTEQLQKSVCNENNLEDEQKLLSLYSTTQDTSRKTETSSKTDGIHNQKRKISVLDKLGNRNSCLVNKQTHIDSSKIRIKSIKSLCKTDASTKVDKGKVSNDIKSIKHYFSSQFHKPDVNRALTDEISAINTANIATDGKKKLLCVTLNNKENGPNHPKTECKEKLYTEKNKSTLVKKRKRIVIIKPPIEKSIEDEMHRPVKCQKVHTGRKLDIGEVYPQKTQREKNGSFLDCLDSFI